MRGKDPDLLRESKRWTKVELLKELMRRRPDFDPFDPEEERRYRDRLRQEIRQLMTEGEIRKVLEQRAEPFRVPGHDDLYYPGQALPSGGSPYNKASETAVLVCPRCQARVLLHRFGPEDIWLLKRRGLSNADIGRLLGVSRERVRQLCKRYEEIQRAEITTLVQADPDDLVKRAERIENYLVASGRLRRRVDKRTKKKRIIAELERLKRGSSVSP